MHRAGAVLLALAAAAACGRLGTDLDAVVAIEVTLPDSGIVAVGDTLVPRARALNGRGDSVSAAIRWAALDTGVVAVVDSVSGATVGRKPGNGRIQARVETLRSNPVTVVVRAVPLTFVVEVRP